jgi:hypothetical protein
VFGPGSRYASIDTATLTVEGVEVVYVRRRFLPQPDDLAQIGTEVVRPGDRLDNVAGRSMGDPELFWRLADGNRAMDPNDLTVVPGRVLRVTLPAGFPGGSGA